MSLLAEGKQNVTPFSTHFWLISPLTMLKMLLCCLAKREVRMSVQIVVTGLLCLGDEFLSALIRLCKRICPRVSCTVPIGSIGPLRPIDWVILQKNTNIIQILTSEVICNWRCKNVVQSIWSYKSKRKKAVPLVVVGWLVGSPSRAVIGWGRVRWRRGGCLFLNIAGER